MTDFKPSSLCILGRQPAIGLAELESLYGAPAVRPVPGGALLDIAPGDINFQRLGGTQKTAKVLAELPFNNFAKVKRYLLDNVPKHTEHLPDGKFTLGLSVYGLSVSLPELNRAALELKRVVKQTGRPVRVVPNKSLALNSAQVLHNKLTHRGAWELIIFSSGNNTILAQTIFVQDIEGYAARDQARPSRDARAGMLPPKLAQILVNLAAGHLADKDPAKIRILDPFCGSGVVLQEALLMGYHVIGSDINPKMVDYATNNIRWLFDKYPNLQGQVVIEQGDALSGRWPAFSAIASEVDLGPPLNMLPRPEKMYKIRDEADKTIEDFLINIKSQIGGSRMLALAVPAWRKPEGGFIHLPIIAKLTDVGYNRKRFKHVRDSDLIYHRENQTVARELLVLNRL